VTKSKKTTKRIYIYLCSHPERDKGAVTSNHYIVRMGQRVSLNCDYSGEVKWFFMRNPQVPDRRPQSWSKNFYLVTNEHDSGFYACMGSKGDGKMYISKIFLEVISKFVIDFMQELAESSGIRKYNSK